MINELNNFKDKLKTYTNIEFLKFPQRNISKEIIIEYLHNPVKLLTFERQQHSEEVRYRLQFDLSSKYDLIIVIRFEEGKDLKIITFFKTNRKWQKKLLK